METIIGFLIETYNKFGGAIFVPIILLTVIGVGAQFMLYEKCRLPGVACLVPFWNVVVFLKIMGRPWHHSLLIIIPPLAAIGISIFGGYNLASYGALGLLGIVWLGFIIKVYIELCNSFGKTGLLDYVLIIIFNGFYVLNLGLSNDVRYKGPVYKTKENKTSSEAKLA
jgi:hypothetical protein